MKQKSRKDQKVSRYCIKTGLRAGYRPVHGLVAPDGWTRWVPGWYDMDSAGKFGAGDSAPPPPPE